MKKKNGRFDRADGVTLKEYMCQKILGLEDRIELNLKLNQVALDKAQIQMEERLERMNEFRDQLSRQAVTFVTRESLDLMLRRIVDDKRATYAMWLSLLAAAVSLVGLIVAVVK